ncbi:MAG TPA: hypothetical protein VIF43_01910 [Patescibacteria group bacterium]|jgi:hypothetical protein
MAAADGAGGEILDASGSAGATADVARERSGGYVEDMVVALARADQGLPATDADRTCYRTTAECIDSLYDGSIIPTDVPPGFDRDIAFQALQVEANDPRDLAETISKTLTAMAEGGTANEEDLETVQRVFKRYRYLYA